MEERVFVLEVCWGPSGANVSWVLHKEGRTETGGLGAEGGIAFQKDRTM